MSSMERQNTHGRLIGLGQNPTSDMAEAVLQIGFTQVPVIEYVTWTVNLPLLDSEIGSTFGNEIDVLQNPKSVIGVDAVDSSFVVNGILQTDMLVMGFGVHAFGEPQAFTTIGNSISALQTSPASPPPVSSDVWTANDLASNSLNAPTQNAPIKPAIMEWGVADWEAMWHLLNAYQFQWRMQQRYLLINELAADVAYFGPYAEANAAGTSEKAVQPFARRVNDRYRSKGAPNIFEPINFRRVGSATGVAPATTTNHGVFHPTRDFDLAPVTWGGLRAQGGAACCSPFRKLIKPVLLERGIPIGMLLTAQDEFHQKEMQKWMSISESQGGLSGNLAFDGSYSGFTPVNANVALELTLDTAFLLVPQSTQTDREIFKGGTFKLAFLIKGFEIWGPWKQFIASQMGDYIATASSLQGGPMGLLPVAH